MCQRLDTDVYVSQRDAVRPRLASRTHGAVLAVSNIPAKWVCSPHWEARSIKQPLWHLENPFTMIETIQLKPLQSVFSFPRAGSSPTYQNTLEKIQKWSQYQYIKLYHRFYASGVLNPSFRFRREHKSDKGLCLWNSWRFATERLIQEGADAIITFSYLFGISSFTNALHRYWEWLSRFSPDYFLLDYPQII